MIRTFIVIAMTMTAAGCASTGENTSYSLGMGSPQQGNTGEHHLYCPDHGPSECHQQARQICGDAGYRQVRQPGSTSTSEMGGSGDLRNQRPTSTSSRRTISQTQMTVRCKTPKPDSD